MSTELLCPECGGKIGVATTDNGDACTCVKPDYPAPAAAPAVSVSAPAAVHPSRAVAKTKVCCICAKDLNGKKRLHDSRGYWCVECHRADKEANKPQGIKCNDCGRIMPESAMQDVDGDMICVTCRSERNRIAKEKRKFSPVEATTYREAEKVRIYVLLGVFLLLVLVIILGRAKIWHGL